MKLEQFAAQIRKHCGIVFFTGAGITTTRRQLLRPFPNFGDINTSVNDGESWYHSGQFRLEKRFTRNYTIQTSYTWSKWLQETEYLNAGDAAPTKMISDQDVPHRLSLSAMYAFPFGKNQRWLTDAGWLTNAVVGGWQIQTVYAYQSGFPIPFGSFNTGNGNTSGDLFYNGGEIAIDNPTTDRWFNTAAFTSLANATSTNAAPVNHLRTLPYRFSSVRRDSINNVDFSLLKDIHIREGMRVQLRMELINAFNEAYFPNPVVNQTASNFGQISASNQENYARRAQLGVKFLF